MANEFLLLFLGVLGLWFGSSIAVEYGKKIADSLGVSTLIVGLTVTSIGTSLGEITTNIVAGYHRLHGVETSGLAIGTIIGSNVSLITLVLGFCGLFTVYYMERKKGSMRRDWNMLFLAIGIMFLFSVDDNKIDALEAFVMVAVYGAYLFTLFRQEQVFKKVIDNNKSDYRARLFFDLALVLFGIIGVIYSANLVINNGVLIANTAKISEELIGILVGLGTSLPELTISLHSIFKGSHGLSIGNLIGGGIVDPLLSLGSGALIAPVFVTDLELSFDIPFMFIATLVAWLFFMRGGKLDKFEATLLMLMYGAFLYLKFFVVGTGV